MTKMHSSIEIHQCVKEILDSVKTFEHDYKYDDDNYVPMVSHCDNRYPLLHYVSHDTPRQTEVHNYINIENAGPKKRETTLDPNFSSQKKGTEKSQELELVGLIGASLISIGGTFLLANDTYIRLRKQQLNSKFKMLNGMTAYTGYKYDALSIGVKGAKWLDIFEPRTKTMCISKIGAVSSSLCIFGGFYFGSTLMPIFGFLGLAASFCWAVDALFDSLDTSNIERRLYYDFYHQLEAFIKKIWRATAAPPEYYEKND